jgi:hypothetical protein
MLCITRKGQVLHVGINENSLVSYIVGQLRDSQLAIEVASRLNLPGAYFFSVFVVFLFVSYHNLIFVRYVEISLWSRC